MSIQLSSDRSQVCLFCVFFFFYREPFVTLKKLWDNQNLCTSHVQKQSFSSAPHSVSLLTLRSIIRYLTCPVEKQQPRQGLSWPFSSFSLDHGGNAEPVLTLDLLPCCSDSIWDEEQSEAACFSAIGPVNPKTWLLRSSWGRWWQTT